MSKDNSKNKLYVLNTFTNQYEEIEVTEEVYQEYRRTNWNIKYSDKAFYKNNICISQMKQDTKNSDNTLVEESDKFNPEKMLIDEERFRSVLRIIDRLPVLMRNRFKKHFLENMTIQEIANQEKVSERSVRLSIKTAKEKLKKMIKHAGVSDCSEVK